jgi:hypothetical protein
LFGKIENCPEPPHVDSYFFKGLLKIRAEQQLRPTFYDFGFMEVYWDGWFVTDLPAGSFFFFWSAFFWSWFLFALPSSWAAAAALGDRTCVSAGLAAGGGD